jgi:S-adenosylmethionine decarboxylase proenzyme
MARAAFFPPFGIYPDNAIVGGSADIATGVALAKSVPRQGGLVVANIGDASSACGPVWEAVNFATMGQYWTLWDPDHRGGLPILFAFIDAFRRKRAVIEAGEGPVLLDILTYRQSGHSPSDASSYRTREELALWQAVDAIRETGRQLLAAKVATEADLAALRFHAFNPFGVSGIVVIAESHLSIHTWPEYGCPAMDIFTCGDVIQPEPAAEYIARRLGCKTPSLLAIKRGVIPGTTAKLPHKVTATRPEAARGAVRVP